jgi:purine-cytosine permease-like protein
MRRIKFDYLQYNWFLIILTLLSFLCVIFGFLEIYKFENPKIT